MTVVVNFGFGHAIFGGEANGDVPFELFAGQIFAGVLLSAITLATYLAFVKRHEGFDPLGLIVGVPILGAFSTLGVIFAFYFLL